MNKLQAGFARVNITPMMGIGIGGYFKPRYVEGILDELEINALAVACDDDKAVIISIDNLELQVSAADDFRNHISEVTGVPADCVYIHATHSHTTPFILKDAEGVLEQEYYKTVYHKMADVAKMALEDLQPAQMGYGIGHEYPLLQYISNKHRIFLQRNQYITACAAVP